MAQRADVAQRDAPGRRKTIRQPWTTLWGPGWVPRLGGEGLCRSASARTGTEPPRRKGIYLAGEEGKAEQAESKGIEAGRWGPCVKDLQLLTSSLNSELSLGRRGGRGSHVSNFHIQRFFTWSHKRRGTSKCLSTVSFIKINLVLVRRMKCPGSIKENKEFFYFIHTYSPFYYQIYTIHLILLNGLGIHLTCNRLQRFQTAVFLPLWHIMVISKIHLMLNQQ